MTTHDTDPEKEKMMRKDYLWDGSGAPDREIQRLESLLADFRHADRAFALPAGMPAPHGKFGRALVQMSPPLRLAAAAAILFALGITVFFTLRPKTAPDLGPGWDVANLQGAPQIGSKTIAANQAPAKLHVGQTIVTNSDSRASLSESELGEIRIDPNSRVRLVQAEPNRKRIQLEVGTIHAAIWAPPTQFIVETPSATAVDLGCRYTLQVAADGSGTIRTTLGWVGFHWDGRDSFIPAGAMCATRPPMGPGTPYFEDAAPSFRDALREFDQALPASDVASQQLEVILKQARPRDGLTLWHLLSRTNGPERAQVYARFAALVPPPPSVTRDGILQLDPHTLDLYWNALGLGDISIWRFWEQNSNPHAAPPSQEPPAKKQM